MRRREARNNTQADIHEKDTAYLERCLRTAGMAAEHYGWVRIPYMKDGVERDARTRRTPRYTRSY